MQTGISMSTMALPSAGALLKEIEEELPAFGTAEPGPDALEGVRQGKMPGWP